MAKDATDLFKRYTDLHKLSADLSRDVCEIATYVNTREEFKGIGCERSA